jgi:hypothetical protein
MNQTNFMLNNFRCKNFITDFSKLGMLSLLLLLRTTSAISQDSLVAFREFAKLRQVYGHLPVQIRIDIQNSATPFTTPLDTLESAMNIYVGAPGMYLEAEGLEEIVNDSLVIMVNNPAKQIILYPNNGDVMKKMQESLSIVLPDSSLKTLAEKYTSLAQDVDGNQRKIILRSREMLYGTKQPKEIITVTFEKSSSRPIEIDQAKLKPMLIDSANYANFVNDKIYDGKLIRIQTSKGNIFFLVKESRTLYRFRKIDYDVPNPPAREQDRIVKAKDGSYMPAKGYEDYLLSKEF